MWMFVLKDFTTDQRRLLVKNKEEIISIFINLLNESSFNYAVSSRKGDTMRLRNTKLKNKLTEVI